MKILIRKLNADYLGMAASISCAIHCALLPLVATSLPLIGFEFMANIWVEISMLTISMLIAAFALSKTYPKHKSIQPVMLLVIGLLSISLGHFVFHEIEYFLIPLGGFAIAFAHYINWKKTRMCNRN